MCLPKKFYDRNPATVAEELLGAIIIKNDIVPLKAKIVETEAYYEMRGGIRTKNTKMISRILDSVGNSFIYMVHGYWLFNIITHYENRQSGVLIRAVEPLKGTKVMRCRRKTNIFENLTSGPGKFTQAFGINKSHNGLKLYVNTSPIYMKKWENNIKVVKTQRIGVKKNPSALLRFYIEENPFVSKF
jgi:DNA-3-methyladenine glycosylase